MLVSLFFLFLFFFFAFLWVRGLRRMVCCVVPGRLAFPHSSFNSILSKLFQTHKKHPHHSPLEEVALGIHSALNVISLESHFTSLRVPDRLSRHCFFNLKGIWPSERVKCTRANNIYKIILAFSYWHSFKLNNELICFIFMVCTFHWWFWMLHICMNIAVEFLTSSHKHF